MIPKLKLVSDGTPDGTHLYTAEGVDLLPMMMVKEMRLVIKTAEASELMIACDVVCCEVAMAQDALRVVKQ